MTPKKPAKIPTSEAALKRAMKRCFVDASPEVYAHDAHMDILIEIVADDDREVLWQGWLSDLYKKRKSLKGVTKRLKRAIR